MKHPSWFDGKLQSNGNKKYSEIVIMDIGVKFLANRQTFFLRSIATLAKGRYFEYKI